MRVRRMFTTVPSMTVPFMTVLFVITLFVAVPTMTVLSATDAAAAAAVSAPVAEPPVVLGASHVVDHARVLAGNDKTRVEKAIASLHASAGLGLYVVYTPAFTSPSRAQAWADTTADKNDLGEDDYLLAIATTSRTFYVSAAGDSTINANQLRAIDAAIKKPLHNGQWAAAGIAAATGLANPSTIGTAAGWGPVIPAIVLALILAGLIVYLLRRRRRSRSPDRVACAQEATRENELAILSLRQLQEHARDALAQADAAIASRASAAADSAGVVRGSPAELTAVAAATSRVAKARSLHHKLDESREDSELQVRQWYEHIVLLCDEAIDLLDETNASAPR